MEVGGGRGRDPEKKKKKGRKGEVRGGRGGREKKREKEKEKKEKREEEVKWKKTLMLFVKEFWKSWPLESWLRRWYATFPTSNVASERAFGVVRGLEDDQRRRANEETVSIETLARCNSWVVDLVRQNHGRLG